MNSIRGIEGKIACTLPIYLNLNFMINQNYSF